MKLFSLVCSALAAAASFGAGTLFLSPPQWELSSRHVVHGMPRTLDDRYVIDGAGDEKQSLSLLGREGFVIGYSNKYRIAVFVSMQWTQSLYEASKGAAGGDRVYRPDPDLPSYGRGTPDFENATSGLQRGHLARHADNRAWGEDNVEMGNLVSNLGPMSKSLNEGVWGVLEDAHRTIVTNKAFGSSIWVISGAVLPKNERFEFLKNGVVVPKAYYKIFAWYDRAGAFQNRGYMIPQTAGKEPPVDFLTPIDVIEDLTGLDFFPKLADGVENSVEAAKHTTMWPAR